jgi:1-acyl-sn-glycerol-3-phosphate acyltransferase
MADNAKVPQISAPTLWFFRRVAKRYFRRHFRSVMAQQLHLLREAEGPLIVYGNHSSWWDPLLMILIARVALPGRRHYAPMDAAALARYPIFRRLGVFPVELATGRGAAMFLRTAEAVLRSGGVLWLTPQGRFADPRMQPLQFKPGLGTLSVRMRNVLLVPMAVEYTFWNERLPEALMRIGQAVAVPADASAEQATKRLEQALAAEMQTLRESSIQRDASAFETVLQGGRGSGGMYAVIRRLRAALTGKRGQQDHTPREK